MYLSILLVERNLCMLITVLFYEHCMFQIRVNSVLPTAVKTETHRKYAVANDSDNINNLKRTPYGSFAGTP